MDHTDYVVFLGSADIDENYEMSYWPAGGEKGSAKLVDTVPGGMIANAACVCAGMGVRTYMFDMNGGDSEYDFLFDDLTKYGVDTSHTVRLSGIRETKCMVFRLPGGERSIICVSNNKRPLELTVEQKDFLFGAKYLYGSLWTEGIIKGAADFLREAKAHGTKVMYDIEPNSMRGNWRELMSFANIVSMNEYALERFREGRLEQDFIREMIEGGLEALVITLGGNGCRLITSGSDRHIPGYKVKVVDTTGCGDTFNGSFLASVVKGATFEEAAEFANAAANMKARVLGPRGGITTPEKVHEFICSNRV